MLRCWYMECLPGQDNAKDLIDNLIQIKLTARHGLQMEEFIDKYSANFRSTIAADPNLLTKFEEDEGAVLDQIDKITYH